jgi:hypothetical protein
MGGCGGSVMRSGSGGVGVAPLERGDRGASIGTSGIVAVAVLGGR